MQQPDLIVVGRANGSGKTTLACELVLTTGIKYLGADQIASRLNRTAPDEAAIEAARQFSQELEAIVAKLESVIIESTLSGLSLRRRIEKARRAGYKIRIVFVYLDSPELCVARIKARVAGGGHHVPPEDVHRRFARANQNFWNLYKNAADEWNSFRNAADSFQQIAAAD